MRHCSKNVCKSFVVQALLVVIATSCMRLTAPAVLSMKKREHGGCGSCHSCGLLGEEKCSNRLASWALDLFSRTFFLFVCFVLNNVLSLPKESALLRMRFWQWFMATEPGMLAA